MNVAVESAAGQKPAQPCCGYCIHFCNSPAALEATFAGLSIMSSGNASVKAYDGVCDLHGVYLSYHDHCGAFCSAVAALISAPGNDCRP